ncbi:hypothetical protein [Vibrio splendidus]|uniref:hypothetical protein n=1 Tax=Vibrio splendidus TaxID=29497 RepID=UPI000C837AB7|nr:hypothetical protein [Vibrio splendidus]MAD77583.1 hypothetical protein [Rheinheimera sp.]PMP51672.1 hypothetical protein BCS83_02420 [Vibrio splendidus]
MLINRMSLPDTCFSCQCYQQKGWKTDAFAPKVDNYGFSIEPRKQRFGTCTRNNAEVFWNEKCHLYVQEPDIDVHPCPKRPKPLEPRQESLF